MKKFFFFMYLIFLGSSLFAGGVDDHSTIAFNPVSHTFEGGLTLVAFFQSLGIILGALGVVTSLKLAVDAFRRPCTTGYRK